MIGSVVKRTPVPEIAEREDYPSFFPTPAAEGAIAVRQVTQLPQDVPIYASACSGAVRYSSACSCAGINATTTYAPTPVRYLFFLRNSYRR